MGKSGLLYVVLGCFAPCIPILLLRQEARTQNNIKARNNTHLLNKHNTNENILNGDIRPW